MIRCTALALTLGANIACAEAELVGVYHWVVERDYFGGFSGLEVSDDGLSFHVISDQGYLGTGTIERENDQIVGVTHTPFYLFPDPLRWPVTGDENRDSEGLAVDADGRMFVSYEGIAVIREEPERDGTPRTLPRNPDFDAYQSNGSLEALALFDGAFYTIPERSGRAMRPFPVHRLKDGIWDVAFEIPRRGQFVPVGADIDALGHLYLLERDFNGWAFSTRVRRFGLDGSDETLILQTEAGAHDNLEGIATWHDGTYTRLIMISDDNYRRSQRTEIVEYRLTGE